MPWVALLLVGCLAAMTLVMLVAIWETKRVTRFLVDDRHRILEQIFDTGEVPETWRRRTQASCLRRLDRLIRYSRQSPILRDEEARQRLVARLTTVRSAWAERGPEEFG